ncbi:MAG TPA: efflux RND transporter periplasmic adaptor subunit [Verrucomicrobiae bacterium]|nr:efflux RND transporter periplasmic adaptor subunit [Verrucomicrobiae bacterium]
MALALFIFGTGCKKKKPPPPAPPEVQVLTLTATNLPIFQEWIGTLDGFVNAQIRAQVTGYLLTQNYAEGNKVKAGQPLFQIDPRPFQATLDQATARLAQDQAQVEKNRLDVERFTPLAKDKAISQQQLDDSVQSLNAAQAAIKADQATIENATLNLGFTKIISPVDGLAGLAQVQIGDLVGPSSAVLTTVSALNPMKVYFQVNEQSYLAFWRQFISPENSNSAPPLDLILSDGSTYPEKGKFYFADRQVSIDTGTLQIVGLFSNENFMLRPGQYSRVRAQTQTITNALVVPQRAVAELQGSYQVTVVGESNKVNVVSVKVGQQVGTDWVIADGLKPGERVVVEGTLKAKAGTVVNPKPWPAPTNAPPAK